MAAICYSDPLSAVPTNEQLLGAERTRANNQSDNSITEGLFCVYTDEQISFIESSTLHTEF